MMNHPIIDFKYQLIKALDDELDKVQLEKFQIEYALIIFKELTKIRFIDFTMKITSLSILNINLLLEEESFLIMSFPLRNNVQDLEIGELLYTHTKDDEFKFSYDCKVNEMAEIIKTQVTWQNT